MLYAQFSKIKNLTTYNLHQGVGTFYVSQDTPRILNFWQCLHTEIQWRNQRNCFQNKNHRLCSTLQPQHRGYIQSHIWATINHRKKNGFVLNKDKLQFCQDAIPFWSHQITSSGMTPSESMQNPVINFSIPKNNKHKNEITGNHSCVTLNGYIPTFSINAKFTAYKYNEPAYRTTDWGFLSQACTTLLWQQKTYPFFAPVRCKAGYSVSIKSPKTFLFFF